MQLHAAPLFSVHLNSICLLYNNPAPQAWGCHRLMHILPFVEHPGAKKSERLVNVLVSYHAKYLSEADHTGHISIQPVKRGEGRAFSASGFEAERR